MSFLARGLSNFIGIVAPVVQSFKVLKKPTKPKLIQCLHFWTIYGSFLITDWFLNTFFISCFIPFYDFFVLTFTILLSVPQVGFASMLYTKFLAPFLRKYERRIDSISGLLMDKLWEKMPVVAMTVPAVLASIVTALNSTTAPSPLSQMEVEEIEDEVDASSNIAVFNFGGDGQLRSRSTSLRSNSGMRTPARLLDLKVQPTLNQSFEIQEEEEDDMVMNSGDENNLLLRRPLQREIKREVLEEEEDDFVVFPRSAAPVARTMRTRRQTRSNSVL